MKNCQKNDYYNELLNKASSNPTEKIKTSIAAIEKDLFRTFPDNIVFQNKDSQCLQMLKRILTAYAVRNPNVGYW